MTILKIPPDINYDNFQKEVDSLSQEIRKNEKVELDFSDVVLNSITKALVRVLLDEFSDKIEIEEDLKKEIIFADAEAEAERLEEGAKKKEEPFLVRLGEKIFWLYDRVFFFFVIMVDMIFYSFQFLFDKKFVLKHDTTKNAYDIGYKAIPIVFLLAFLIGFTIALQAAIQLAQFGGQTLIATMSTMIMTKELGPLITAIIIAGRTGSSITAEIGTMVVMEEVDALKTMGIKPFKFLLVPKFWAFTLVMPILTIIANIAGITGGLIVSSIYNIPVGAFITQMLESLLMKDIFWGTIKSISFAWVILAVGSFKGINVRGGADAVGRATTESVVVSIFMVVAIDALFSIILYT
jgi:phospholipid/cholesterol/gamma-HCH transport system permease protein